MTLEQVLLERVRRLAPDQQRAVLAYIDSLMQEAAPQRVQPLKGLWADTQITAHDIDEARHELWDSFRQTGG